MLIFCEAQNLYSCDLQLWMNSLGSPDTQGNLLIQKAETNNDHSPPTAAETVCREKKKSLKYVKSSLKL